MSIFRTKLLSVLAFIMTVTSATMYAQAPIKVTGHVTDAADGTSLPGVIVYAKDNPATASSVNFDGSYEISTKGDAVLVFTLLGYDDVEVAVESRSVIDVQMHIATSVLNESVVSALGIERQAKSLTYSTQTVKSEELTRARDVNMMNALAGKAAGVTVTQNASGLGGASKVSIRGFRSVNGNNQPLYVVNGVPISNSVGSQLGSLLSGGHDGGDGMSNLNPDDIESISILKGASAAALYGTEAANGVIMITTKKGAAGRTSVTFNSNTTVDQVAYLPEFQSRYGESEGYYSWGGKYTGNLDKQKQVLDFFQTGVSAMNSFSVSTGTDRNQTYISYGNTSAKGVYEGSKFGKHNITFRNVTKAGEKVTLDANFQLIHQDVMNRPRPGGAYSSPLPGIYHVPVGRDVSQYQKEFEVLDPDRNIMSQAWYKALQPHEENPWFLLRNSRQQIKDRLMGGLNVKYDITPWLNIQARGTIDAEANREEVKFYATTNNATTGSQNGLYEYGQNTSAMYYGDVLANFNKKFNDFNVTATVGASATDNQGHGLYSTSYTGKGLSFANIFTVANTVNQNFSQWSNHSQKLGVFATASLGFKDYLFVDLTARNDWSSALAYTESFKKGFFYPSVGATLLLSEMVSLPSWINYSKVRASYANVGNDIPTRITNPTGSVNYNGTINANTTVPFGDLKPEISSSVEIGTEWHFLNDRITLDATWYQTHTTNQLFMLSAPEGSGYQYYYVNAGDIQNTGFEAILGITPVMTNDFIWKSQFNMSSNKNTVVRLHEDIKQFVLTDSGSDAYRMWLTEGGSYGDFYGYKFARDEQGNIIYDENGLPTKSGDYGYVGNATPDFLLGWNNSIDYKNFSLSFLVDCRFGGNAMSLTQADLDFYGLSETSAAARDKGYVELEGKKINDIEGFYRRVGNRDGISEYYTYDATNIRLRELSLGYSLPKRWLDATGFVKDATFSIVGRNLFIFYCAAPYDTDASLSAGAGVQGVDYFSVPATRSIGFNIKLGF